MDSAHVLRNKKLVLHNEVKRIFMAVMAMVVVATVVVEVIVGAVVVAVVVTAVALAVVVESLGMML